MTKASKKPVAKKPAKKIVKKQSAKKAVKKTIAKKVVAKKSTKKKKEDLMCFLTTACVHHYGLSDDGIELTTLRHFRDSFLLKTKSGKALVADYYALSPILIDYINKDSKKELRFAYIYNQVHLACKAIQLNQPVKAKNVYTKMVNRLRLNYSL